MKRSTKRLFIAAAIFLALAIAGCVCASRYIHNNIHDYYCKWQAAELVVEYRQAQGKMPESWDALWAYFRDKDRQGDVFYSFHVVSERIIIDFPSLPALEREYSSEKEIPKIIKARRGTEGYWYGTEPNQLINRRILQGKATELPPARP
jgi:hypothetical protein